MSILFVYCDPEKEPTTADDQVLWYFGFIPQLEGRHHDVHVHTYRSNTDDYYRLIVNALSPEQSSEDFAVIYRLPGTFSANDECLKERMSNDLASWMHFFEITEDTGMVTYEAFDGHIMFTLKGCAQQMREALTDTNRKTMKLVTGNSQTDGVN